MRRDSLHYRESLIAAYLDSVRTRREAIASVRSEADYLIDQAERIAQGWDRGAFRDDDTLCNVTIRQRVRESVKVAFSLSAKFATK